MNNNNNELKNFYLLWSTQSLSQLGSAMTEFALTLWLYEKTGSALSTAALTICTYAPYVIMSIFAGAVSDRYDKKKTMLVCDVLAALQSQIAMTRRKPCLCVMCWRHLPRSLFLCCTEPVRLRYGICMHSTLFPD